jgi:MscS family membrane protein
MDNINQFWQVVQDVWEKGLWGIDIGSILVALLIFFIFLFLRQLLARFIVRRLKAVAGRTKFKFDDEIVEALQKPLTFIPVIIGFFLAHLYLLHHGLLTKSLESATANLLRSMIIYFIFWSLVRLVQPLAFLFKQLEALFSATMVEWLLKGIRVSFILLGAATILQLWDIQVLPLLAGLGVVSMAVALGAQDLFKNLIAGILIIAEHRFNPGDWIKVDNVVEGTVEVIGFRSTLVRQFDKAPVYVPNAKLSDNSVINFSAMTHRRIYWMITVQYCTTVEQLRQIRDRIERYILDSDDFANPPEVPAFVRVDRFSDSSIDIMVYCFTKTTKWGEWLTIKEKLAYVIKDIVEGAGAGFAFPSRSLYIESMPAEPAEKFLPPSK